MRGIDRLIGIMARLRDPETGCPWDRAQDFASIAPYTIEEAYEVADAIERGDRAALKDELGDLLLQVVFHGRMAEEAGWFGFEDIAQAISDKMVRRHPHLFGEDEGNPAAGGPTGAAPPIDKSAENWAENWERIKAAERAARTGLDAAPSALDGVAAALPALLRAVKIQKRAGRVGFDWSAAPEVLAKIGEETAELRDALAAREPAFRLEEELGDLLFTAVNLARKLELDPELALRRATAKFERRFRSMEAMLTARGEDIGTQSAAQLEAAWDVVKAAEREA